MTMSFGEFLDAEEAFEREFIRRSGGRNPRECTDSELDTEEHNMRHEEPTDLAFADKIRSFREGRDKYNQEAKDVIDKAYGRAATKREGMTENNRPTPDLPTIPEMVFWMIGSHCFHQHPSEHCKGGAAPLSIAEVTKEVCEVCAAAGVTAEDLGHIRVTADRLQHKHMRGVDGGDDLPSIAEMRQLVIDGLQMEAERVAEQAQARN